MASIGHIAVGMAAARAFQPREAPGRWVVMGSMLLWSALSLLPDADVIGFKLGVRYGAAWGHRGATHSFAFAIGLGLAIGLLGPSFGATRLRTAVFACAVLASHALLDITTDGGLGCALLWPFDRERFFAPWRPIPVAPIGAAFFSRAGLRVVAHELVLFAPLFLYALWPRRMRAVD